jgi:hypothetical protein
MKSRSLTYAILLMAIAAIILLGDHTVSAYPESNQSPASQVRAHLNTQVQLKINQTALIEPDHLKVSLVKVFADSRCPSNVACIWAGQVSVQVNISKNDIDLGTLDLVSSSNPSSSSVKTVAGYSIRVVEVNPNPKQNQKNNPSDYTVILVISKS